MEGSSRVLSRSSEDLSSFSSLADSDIDLVLGQDSPEEEEEEEEEEEMVATRCHGLHASAFSHDVDSSWEDSRTDSLSLEMEAALRAALTSRTLTPLLKEELRCKIQLKRLERGEEEITPDFSKKQFAMSMDEVVKKNKKMQQNRMSAQRSRDRQKSLEKNIKSRLDLLQKENTVLAEQAKSLRHACHVAREWLQQHRACLERHTRGMTSSEPKTPLPEDTSSVETSGK